MNLFSHCYFSSINRNGGINAQFSLYSPTNITTHYHKHTIQRRATIQVFSYYGYYNISMYTFCIMDTIFQFLLRDIRFAEFTTNWVSNQLCY